MTSERENQEQLFNYVIRLADNALLTGQRLGEWIGHGPQLEEELAFGNFALDYIGQARAYYTYAGEIEGKGRSEDELAFLRDGIDFHNLLLVEQPNGDFGQTIARQFLFESWYQLFLNALAASTDERLRAIAVRAGKEIRYHLRHTRQWLVRLGDGTEESHRRMQAGIDELWRYTGEMFAADELDTWAADAGIGPALPSLADEWHSYVTAAFEEATLEQPAGEWMASGGKQGSHTEHLGYILADMQFMQRAYPGASW